MFVISISARSLSKAMRSATGETDGRPLNVANFPLVDTAPCDNDLSCGCPITNTFIADAYFKARENILLS